MIFAAIYAIVIGIAMITQWTITIIRHEIPKPKDDPVSGRGSFDMAFHWTAEFLTALILIVAGISLISETTWSSKIYLVGTGMLIYTVINSPGFFAQQRKWSMVAMFAVIIILTIISLILVL
ncbi:MAG: hypothetical protein PHQ86_04440 [Dehalococcoidales bacterium]|nr:hypothetical protein [Dehalococcoidales bacterium]